MFRRNGIPTFCLMTSVLAGIVATACLFRADLQADEDKPKKKSPIEIRMRQKLDAAAKVLEGLATEDASQVKEGAQVLLDISKAEVWQVLKNSEYREHTQTFRSAIRRMDEAAAEGQFASAQLEWLDATKRCFDCHNYIRKSKAAAK